MADKREFCLTTGKLIHDTPQKAAVVARNQARFGKPTDSYHCEHCAFWHTGRSSGKRGPLKGRRRRNF